jgi:endonuclease YncB( thermonuclease family)
MYRRSFISLILVLLYVSCDIASHRGKDDSNSSTQVEELATKKAQKDSQRLKKGERYSINIVGVSDGDTFTGLMADNQQIKCRIYGIDAPEKKQAFGNRSKQVLSDLIFGKNVEIEIQGRHYQRVIVRVCTHDGKDVSAEMLKTGMAWHYKQYSKDNEYAKLEYVARQQKVGLWIDKNPTEPWLFRKEKK